MKKLILVFATVLFAHAASAQFALGVKGGINLNKIHTDAGTLGDNYKESLDSKTGFSAGLFARIGEGVYIQPELLYTERNGKILYSGTGYDIKIKNIDVPVLVGVKLFDVLRINGGPVATLKLKEEHTFLNNVTTTLKEKDAFKNATFGYQLGAGLSFGKLDIDVRKEGSLGSISSKHFQDEKFNQKTDGWQLTLGLRVL
jgi:hypothetical protein